MILEKRNRPNKKKQVAKINSNKIIDVPVFRIYICKNTVIMTHFSQRIDCAFQKSVRYFVQ